MGIIRGDIKKVLSRHPNLAGDGYGFGNGAGDGYGDRYKTKKNWKHRAIKEIK